MDLADASVIVRLAFMEHYHMRSNIESAFSMIKGKFGDSVRSKSDTGQVNEALCKVLRCSATTSACSFRRSTLWAWNRILVQNPVLH